MEQLPKIPKGKRATVAGRTGSGKTSLASWFFRRSAQHWLILDPKHTAGYKTLPDSQIIHGIKEKTIAKSLEENRFTILRPSPNQSNPEAMDMVIEWAHNNFENIGVGCDELYTLHENGRPGPGLIGLLTRGRELDQSFFGLTQRPHWISLFCFSEADFLGQMDLQLEKDRKRFYEFTGNPESLSRLQPHKWLWYEAESDSLKKYGPVPLR